jgi:hypothetical protein
MSINLKTDFYTTEALPPHISGPPLDENLTRLIKQGRLLEKKPELMRILTVVGG